MRRLAAGIALTGALLLSGCASLQKYPAFNTQPGGRIVTFDRSGVTNLLPATRAVPESGSDATTYGRPVR